MADQEVHELLKKYVAETRRKDFRINLVSIGLVAVLIGSGFYVATTIAASRNTKVVIEQAQGTLKTTCDYAKEANAKLPARDRDICQAAADNKLPERAQVVDEPDPNDPEFQDPERQDGERQDAETQDPEIQEPETQDPEAPDGETDDPELQDDEIQESESQDPEIQEPEIQEPEEQNYPVCEPGYTRGDFIYFGPDGLPDTGDEQTWRLCIKDQ